MPPLLVIRHGETRWNTENRLQGQSDIPLSESGRRQLQSWSIPAPYSHFDCISSPLQRAVETARLLGFEPTIEPALREMSWGRWEGQIWSELQSRLGQALLTDYKAYSLDFCAPQGESPREVQERLKSWLAKLHKPTVSVTHKGVLQALYSLATGWSMADKAPVKFQHGFGYLFNVNSGLPTVSTIDIQLSTDSVAVSTGERELKPVGD